MSVFAFTLMVGLPKVSFFSGKYDASHLDYSLRS